MLKKFSLEDKKEFGDYMSKNAVDHDKCIGCRACIRTGCPALSYNKDTKKVTIDRNQCVACDVCAQVCPKKAIDREVVLSVRG